MGEFVYYTDEQKEQANAVYIADILRREGEEIEKSGNEWRWKRHRSVTFRENCWYRHSQQVGSHAIDFMQEFFGMTYPEAVAYLLGEKMMSVRNTKLKADHSSNKSISKKEEENKKRNLEIPQKNESMKRVYAYLTQKRYIDKDILSFFVNPGILYESKDHHNIVFAGTDHEGKIRHVHLKGTCSDGEGFKMNKEGSDAGYGFCYRGTGTFLYVFEAPVDMLSFLTLYQREWQKNSYVSLCGVSEHAMLTMLDENPNINTVVLCLDHDPAGIEACGRLAEILRKNKKVDVKRLQPQNKDWNEDLKSIHGETVVPAQAHPKVVECEKWMCVLKKVIATLDPKYAVKENICRYYQEVYETLKKGNTRKNLEEAFDGPGMLLTGVLIKCMEQEGVALGRNTNAENILENLCRRYKPYQDKGNFHTRIRNIQKSYNEVIRLLDKKKCMDKLNREELVKAYMSLSMECIKAHIFVSVDMKESVIKQEPKLIVNSFSRC